MADYVLLPNSMAILEMDFERIFDVTFFVVVLTPSPCEIGIHQLNIAMPLPSTYQNESINVINGFWDITAKPVDLFSWSFSSEEKLCEMCEKSYKLGHRCRYCP